VIVHVWPGRTALPLTSIREKDFSLAKHKGRYVALPLLLDSGIPIEAVQDLLDHKHITTTQNLRSGGGR